MLSISEGQKGRVPMRKSGEAVLPALAGSESIRMMPSMGRLWLASWRLPAAEDDAPAGFEGVLAGVEFLAPAPEAEFVSRRVEVEGSLIEVEVRHWGRRRGSGGFRVRGVRAGGVGDLFLPDVAAEQDLDGGGEGDGEQGTDKAA